MKRKHAPLLFLLMLGLFWLSLLLTFKTRARHFSNQVSLPYTQIAGIETLEIDLPCSKKEYLSIDIHFVDEPHVTVELHGIEDPAAITNLFVRDGKRLIVRPEIRQKLDAANGDGTKASATLPYDDGYWRIDNIKLPMHMRHVKSRHSGLSFVGSQKEGPRQHLPSLLVEAENADSNFSALHVGALTIRNHPHSQPCTDGRPEALVAGRVSIHGSVAAEQLSIESVGGFINLDNTQTLSYIQLRTTPETGIQLDRMDAMQRLRWTPLPAPESSAPSATGNPLHRASVPSIKAQNN